MREGLLDILACPLCRAPVLLDSPDQVVCRSCSRRYLIRQNIPLMLTEDQQLEINHDLSDRAGRDLVKQFTGEGVSLRERIVGALRAPHHACDIDKRPMLDRVLAQAGDGSVLEIGSGMRRLSDSTVNLDIYPYCNVDVVGYGQTLPFLDGSFHGIVSQAVLEHTRDPWAIVAEMWRTLAPGGLVYTDVPFLQHFHGFPSDYYRWTILGLEELFGRFQKLETGVVAGPSSLMVSMLRDYWEMLMPEVRYLKKASIAAVGWATFPLKYLDIWLRRKDAAHTMALSVYYLGMKPSQD